MVYHPGGVLDLPRCGLLISNIFSPQLDHRPAFRRLEDLAASAALSALSGLAEDDHGPNYATPAAGTSPSPGFDGLDLADPRHLLAAAEGLRGVLFGEAGLAVNLADPHDPLNGSLADVLACKRGNQWSIAIIALHVAAALGLPCGLVGSADAVMLRLGQPPAAALLLDLSDQGRIYSWPAPPQTGSGASAATGYAPSSAEAQDSASAGDDEWSKALRERLAAADKGGSSSSSTMSLDADSRSVFSEWVVDDDPGSGGGSDLWGEVAGSAAADAATNNSWKLLYGPAALAPDGPSSSGVDAPAANDSGWVDTIVSAAAGDVGVLDSPFAALAGSAFPWDAAADAGSTASAAGSFGSAGSNGSTMDEAGSSGSADSSRVSSLSAPDLVRLGGLQPVSGRVLLQQMLGGMKLALMMSGRLDELLMVLRYLRATDPFCLADLRDEALTLLELQRPEEAAPLLREFLAVAPGAPDADMVREVLTQALLSMEISRNRARRNKGQ